MGLPGWEREDGGAGGHEETGMAASPGGGMMVLGGLDSAVEEESCADAPGRNGRDPGCWSRNRSNSRGRLWSMSPVARGWDVASRGNELWVCVEDEGCVGGTVEVGGWVSVGWGEVDVGCAVGGRW